MGINICTPEQPHASKPSDTMEIVFKEGRKRGRHWNQWADSMHSIHWHHNAFTKHKHHTHIQKPLTKFISQFNGHHSFAWGRCGSIAACFREDEHLMLCCITPDLSFLICCFQLLKYNRAFRIKVSWEGTGDCFKTYYSKHVRRCCWLTLSVNSLLPPFGHGLNLPKLTSTSPRMSDIHPEAKLNCILKPYSDG